jgi:hypothetical protein
MAQVINDPYRSLGGGLGAEFGAGTKQGISQILQHKMKNILEQHEQDKFEKSLNKTDNFTPQHAHAIAEMYRRNPAAAVNMMKLFGTRAVPGEQQEDQISQNFNQQPGIDATGRQNLQNLMAQQQRPSLQNPMISNLMQQMGMAQGQEGQPGYMPPLDQDLQQPQQTQQPQGPSKIPLTQRVPLYQGDAAAKMAQRERFHSEDIARRTYESVRKPIEEAALKVSGADAALREIDNLDELNKMGQLYQGPNRAILEKFGLENIFTNTPTHIAQKSINRLLTDVASHFKVGGKQTNLMFQALEKGIPSLLNTPGAMTANIALTKADQMLTKARNEEIANVLGEYEAAGKPVPLTYMRQVEQRIAPKAQQYAKTALNVMREELRKYNTANPSKNKSFPDARRALPGTQIEKNGVVYSVNSSGTDWEPAGPNRMSLGSNEG